MNSARDAPSVIHDAVHWSKVKQSYAYVDLYSASSYPYL